MVAEELGTVYNRGFWDGYYLGGKMGEWAGQYGSQATRKKVYVGKIMNYSNICKFNKNRFLSNLTTVYYTVI